MTSAPLVDHNAMIGPYPFRELPDPSPERLLADMDRLSVGRAWVGHVPSIWYSDVAAGNSSLLAWLDPHRDRLMPVPAVNPAFPGWEREVDLARSERCPAVRTYPSHYGFPTSGPQMADLAAACAESNLELVLTVRLEDPRQRHRLDAAADLIGADVRATVRAHRGVQLLVTNADRALVEEVHFGSTPEESARIRWDISGIWGPPEDDLAHLFRTVGRGSFVFGTLFPFRLCESAHVKLELTT